MVLGLRHTRVVEALAEGTQSSTGEENDSLKLLVEEKIVETPYRAVLPEGVKSEVRIVRVDVAVEQLNLGVESVPQLVVDLPVLAGGRDAQQIVDVVGHKLQVWFFSEFFRFSRRKVVVREGGVES